MTAGPVDLHLGDSKAVLPTLPDCSVDSIVTDPPYELGFMGRKWDASGIAYDAELWRECLRVLKPGGHLLAFGGSRTYHRMACAIEDAGFEIRDQIMWLYGSGFPKSLDVSKALDRAAGAEREVIGPAPYSRGRAGQSYSDTRKVSYDYQPQPVTAPATDAAKQWDGWGTALKPAHEPIVVARKPLVGTVAENVLVHGTGALNIDGCRVPTEDELCGSGAPPLPMAGTNGRPFHATAFPAGFSQHTSGRWPANVIHDGSDEVLAAFPDAPGQSGAVTGREPSSKTNNVYGQFDGRPATRPRGDTGSAARFFYCAKASRRDRNEGCEQLEKKSLHWSSGDQNPGSFQSPGSEKAARNHHPTVKPTELMRYLCRLVTPPGGVVLDPFMGSGSTGKAAVKEGFRFVGIEREAEYFEIARARIADAGDEQPEMILPIPKPRKESEREPDLFGFSAA